jgi:hypothetical protein
MVVLVDVKMGPRLERRADTSLQIPPKRSIMMDGSVAGVSRISYGVHRYQKSFIDGIMMASS